MLNYAGQSSFANDKTFNESRPNVGLNFRTLLSISTSIVLVT